MSALIAVMPSPRPSNYQPWMRWVSRYVNLTFGYGAVRALTYDYEGSKNYYNAKTHHYETKPMLWTDSVGRVCLHSIAAITAWPVMLFGDLKRLECFARGLDRAAYTESLGG
jgi:hypothetical protein